MLVYRVETRNGEGPWATKDKTGAYGYVWHSKGSHCFPNQCGLRDPAYNQFMDHPRKTDFLFAFPSADAMFRYVSGPFTSYDKMIGYFKKMQEMGLFVSMYELLDTTEIFSDDNQCVFLPDKAIRVTRMKPTNPVICKLLEKYCAKTL